MNDQEDFGGYDPDPEEDWDTKPRGREVRSKALAKKPLPPKRRKSSATRILAREKQRRSLELRKGGATYDQIAQAVGYSSPSGARSAVLRAFGEIIQEPAAELRTLQIERLNHFLLILWPQIQAGDTRAIETGLRVMDKLDKLLGTEEAQKVDVNVQHEGAILVVDGNEQEFIAHMKKMAGIQDPIPATSQENGQESLSHPEKIGARVVAPGVTGLERSGTPDKVIQVSPRYSFSVEPGEKDEDAP